MSAAEPAWTREELYEKVWSVPTVQLAAELGISDVALAKRCKQLNVPKPSLGYWAEIAAGQKPAKKPLPPTAHELFARDALKPVANTLKLPDSCEDLHPLAAGIIRAVTKASPYSDDRIHLSEPEYPGVIVTKRLAERAAKTFHVILSNVESVGIPFKPSQSSYRPGVFKKGHDRLFLQIEEIIAPAGVPVTAQTRSTWPNQSPSDIPRGVLSFTINPRDYGREFAKTWNETEKTPLGQVLSQVVSAIRLHFVEAQKQRERDAIEAKKRQIEWKQHMVEWQRKEAARRAEEQKQRHAAALRSIAQQRTNNLIKAAEWLRLFQSTQAFIAECESKWRTAQDGTLTPDQELWLSWARANAMTLSPFEAGYPDPATDGTFDAAAIPEGGPYPHTRSLPHPPTLPPPPSPPDTGPKTAG